MEKSKIIRYITVLLSGIMLLSLFACNNGEAVETDAPDIEPDTENVTDETAQDSDSEASSDNTSSEDDTDSETEYEGPEEPECDSCSFKSVGGRPICQVCGFVARCNGVHGYAADENGHWKPACEHCGKVSGSSQSHEYAERIDNAGDSWEYSFRCKICKYVAYAQYVPFKTTAFYSVGELSGIDTNNTFSSSYRFEAGTGFASYTLSKSGTGTVKLSDGDDVDSESGRYLVIKLRLPTSQSAFNVSIRSLCASKNFIMAFSDLRPGWIAVIVDMTKAASVDADGTLAGYHIDDNEEYYLSYLDVGCRVQAGESLDIAYVMICDTLEEAQEFTADEKQIYTYNDITGEAPSVEKTPCLDKDGNEIIHVFESDENGHTVKESCNQCGLVAVKDEPHSFTQMKVNGELTYACAVCEYLQYGCNINKFFTAQDINNNAVTYYRVDKSILTEGDLEFSRITGRGTAAQVLFARNNYASTDSEEAAAFTVGGGHLLVVRMRTNSPSVRFAIYVSTIEGKETGIILPTTLSTVVSEPDAENTEYGWTTYVIDLPRAATSVFVADANGEYKMHNFYLQMGTNKGEDYTSDVYYDLDFMAFVDSWDELKAIVSDETVVKVNASNNGTLVKTKEQACVGVHSWGESVSGRTYTYSCANCGNVYKSLTVAESVKRYISGFEFARGATVYSATGTKNVLSEGDDTVFGRVNGTEEIWWMRDQKDFSAGGTGANLNGMTMDVGQSKYLVLRARVNDKTKSIALYISTTGKNGKPREEEEVTDSKPITVPTTSGYSAMYIPISAVEAGEWATYVFDLESLISEYYVKDINTDTYVIDSFGIWYSKGLDIDVEFMAFVEDGWKEIGDLTRDETVYYVTHPKNKTYSVMDAATGKCAFDQHSYFYVQNAETDGSTTYAYECKGCGDIAYSKNVSTSVTRFISGNEVANGATTYSAKGTSSVGVGEDGTFYGRVTDYQEIWWMRHQQDFTAGTGNKLNNKFMDVGESKYFVVRIKTSDASKWLSFYVSTTGKNGEGYSVSDDGTVTRPTTNGYTSLPLLLPQTSKTGEWTTYVFNLEEMFADYYVKDPETGHYIIDTFAITYATGFEADIEFMAFVDGDWSDIGALTDDETVVYITDRKNKTFDIKDANTGENVAK